MAVPGIPTPELNVEHFFNSREEASLAAADRIIEALTRRLDRQPRASLVVTGGLSPALCYAALAKANIPWGRVQTLLSDERWVPPTHDDSNEKMVRETLLTGHATEADLLSLYDAQVSVSERSSTLNETLEDLPIPFACSLLGMGEDGHFASLFPDSDSLEVGLQVDHPTFVVPVNTAASPHPRISLTLAALTRSDVIVLLFFGKAKREVYEQAKASSTEFPVSRLLHQKRVPVHVYWAP
jgi:6-phosphogluconolactonase